MRTRPPGRRATATGTAALVVAGLAVWMVPASAADFAVVSVDPADGAQRQTVTAATVSYTRNVSPTSTLVVTRSSGGVACQSAGSTPSTMQLSCAPAGGFAEGTYTLTANATSTDVPPMGPLMTTSTFTVDRTGPVTTVSAPAVDAANQAAVPVSGTTEGLADLVVTVRDAASHTVSAATRAAASGTYGQSLDLSSLSDGPLGVQVVATDRAGNTATGTTTTRKNTAGPQVVRTSPADGTSTSSTASTVTATYDVAVTGGTLDLQRDGTDYAGTPTTSGNTVTFTTQDGKQLLEGRYTAQTTATANGVPGGGSFSFVVDRTAPAAPTLTVPPSVRNAVQASGTGEPGATVTVTVDDAAPATTARTATAVVGTDGRWSTVVDVSSLSDGPLTVMAVQRDAAGNASRGATPAATVKDATAPTAPTVRPTPDPIGAARQRTVVVTGTADPASSVTLVVQDVLGHTAATRTVMTGAPSGDPAGPTEDYRFDPVDVSSLADGTLTFTVTATDAAGNTSTGSRTALKDTVAPTVRDVRFDRDLYNGTTSRTARITATHDGGAGSTSVVVVTDNAGKSATSTGTIMTAPGVDTVIDVSGLADGPLTASVTTTDPAGNTGAPGKASSAKDATPPGGVTQTQGPVTPANVRDYTVQGVVERTVTPVVVEPGATVTVTVDDRTTSPPAPSNASATATTTTVAAPDGSYTAHLDLRALRDGQVRIAVTVTDRAGNAMTYVEMRTKDTVAPAAPSLNLAPPAPDTSNPPTLRTGSDGRVLLTASGNLAAMDVPAAATSTVTIVLTDTAGATRTVLAAPDPTGRYSVQVDVTDLEDGTLTGVARATDGVGNISPPSATASVLKDSVVLAVDHTTPAAGSTTAVVQEVRIAYDEPLGATPTVTVTSSGGQPIGGRTSLDGDRTVVLRFRNPLPDDTYAVTATARDRFNDTVDTKYSFTVGQVPVSPSPSPSATATATSTVSPSPSPSATATVSASPSPSASASPSPSASASPSPSASPTVTTSPSPSPSPSLTPSVGPSASMSPSPSPSASTSPAPSDSPSPSASPSASTSPAPSDSPSPSPSPSDATSPSPSTSASAPASMSPSPSPSTSPSPSASATTTVSTAPPLKPTVTITLAPSTIRPGVVSTLSGTATPGSSLRVKAYTLPSTTYGVVRETVVGADGRYSFGLTPGRNTRLFVEVSDAGGTAMSETRTISVQTNISSAVARTKALTYRFTGSVLPRRAGQLITISQRVKGKDVTLVKTRTLANGSYKVDRRFTKAATLQYKATATGDPQNVAGSTTLRTLKVR